MYFICKVTNSVSLFFLFYQTGYPKIVVPVVQQFDVSFAFIACLKLDVVYVHHILIWLCDYMYIIIYIINFWLCNKALLQHDLCYYFSK